MKLNAKYYDNLEQSKTLKTAFFSFTPPDSELAAQKGALSLFIKLSCESQLDSSNLSKFIWSSVVDTYFSSDNDVISSIKEAKAGAQKQILMMIQNDPAYKEHGIDVELAISVVVGGKFYVSMFGQPNIYMLRDGKLTDVGAIINQNKVEVISALSQDEDIYIFGTVDFEKIGVGDQIFADTGMLLDLFVNKGVGAEYGVAMTSPKVDFSQIPLKQQYGASEQIAQQTSEMTESISPVSEESVVLEDKEVQSGGVEQEIGSAESADVAGVGAPFVRQSQSPRNFVTRDGGSSQNVSTISDQSGPEKVTQLSTENRSKENKISPNKIAAKFQNQKWYPAVSSKLEKTKNKSSEIASKVGAGIGSKYNEIKPKVANKLQSSLETKYGRKLWYKRLNSKLSQLKISTKKPDIVLGDYKIKQLQGKRALQVGVALLIVVSIFVGVDKARDARERAAKAEAEANLIEQVQSSVNKAKTQVKSDPAAAELSLFTAQKKLDESDFTTDSLEEENKGKYSEVLGLMRSLDDEINKRAELSERVGNIELYIDTRIVFGDRSAPTDISMVIDKNSTEGILVSDQGERAIYHVNLFNKRTERLPDSEALVTSPQFVDYGNNGVYVYDTVQGMLKYSFGEDGSSFTDAQSLSGLSQTSIGTQVGELAILNSADWIYMLAPARNSLIRSANTSESAYGLPSVLLGDPVIANSTDFFADLSFYVLSETGTPIKRYNAAQSGLVESPLEIVGLREEMSRPVAGYTGVDMNFGFYVFDQSLKSILKFEKPLEGGGELKHPGQLLFTKQFVYRGDKKGIFENVKDIVVDRNEQALYVLDGTKIWKIKL